MEPENSLLKVNQPRLKRIFQKHIQNKENTISISQLQVLCKNLGLLPVSFTQQLINLSSLRSFISRALNQQHISKCLVNFDQFSQILQVMINSIFSSTAPTERTHQFFKHISKYSKSAYQINLIAIDQGVSPRNRFSVDTNSTLKVRPQSFRNKTDLISPFTKQKSFDPMVQLSQIRKKFKKTGGSHRTNSNSPSIRTSIKLVKTQIQQEIQKLTVLKAKKIKGYKRETAVEKTAPSSESREINGEQQNEVLKVTVKLAQPAIQQEEKLSEEEKEVLEEEKLLAPVRQFNRSITVCSPHSLKFDRIGFQSQKLLGKKLLGKNKKVGKIQMLKDRLEEFRVKHINNRMTEPGKRKEKVIEDHRKFIANSRNRRFEQGTVIGLVFFAWKMQWKFRKLKSQLRVQQIAKE